MHNINPLNIKISRCVLDGQMYELHSYEDFIKEKNIVPNSALLEEYNGEKIVLPYRGNYDTQTTHLPGIYNAGCIDIVVMPNEEDRIKFTPSKIVEMSNNNSIKEILERKDVIAHLDEPWITSPDNITQFNITEDDKPEMICLKTALNAKHVDIDKYAPRFKDNFPNDKRQLKNNGATLNIIKRFCENMDMECLLTLRDKNPDVPNPIGQEITISITDNYPSDEEDDIY